MTKLERCRDGKRLQWTISGNSDSFWKAAKKIKTAIGGAWVMQVDGLDQSYWNLKVGEVIVTVHREHYLGVMLLAHGECDSEIAASNALVERIAEQLADIGDSKERAGIRGGL